MLSWPNCALTRYDSLDFSFDFCSFEFRGLVNLYQFYDSLLYGCRVASCLQIVHTIKMVF